MKPKETFVVRHLRYGDYDMGFRELESVKKIDDYPSESS